MGNDNKPIIGISGSLIIDEGGMFPGYERAYVNNDYVQSVVMAGGIPYIIPMVYDDEVIKEQIKNIDALILSGGHDVNPLLWGEEPSQKLGGILPKRDTYDIKLLKVAQEMHKPILGICRGEHILNVGNGGSLYQDLSFIDGCYIKHNQQHLSNVPTHTVNIVKGTKLYDILGEKVLTNSFHHLGIKDVAPGFVVAARAEDGVVEAIEREGDLFAIGIQWHPEMMTRDYPIMLEIFKRLIEEAKK
ncbi:putative glutamine amidotransferasec [Clostridium tepidiprofundi DSM 19306]|uniref:Putative glutamine amidotransferasec n=1 Tax=Clostridium tepidiprofundi DSM 19306 TaxID=1121338 RepID=A0A151B447_9CLOT|nr:gamma-glutamyl-gamma-aminobutyrate hydrolase family protein [Clostridium tepidiprofundi]KYH34573.1 putative glutamine amidotransferasec [Clostridium tepidiprofundi DSM 19306]